MHSVQGDAPTEHRIAEGMLYLVGAAGDNAAMESFLRRSNATSSTGGVGPLASSYASRSSLGAPPACG